MFKKIILILIIGVLLSYFIPTKSKNFFAHYKKDDVASKTLKEFQARETKTIIVDGVSWTYFSGGKGNKTLLFLHGMGGAYDLWWQQIDAFENDYKIISYSLPEVINTLENVSNGIQKILSTEKVDKFYAVGTSMGGYITQYLVNTMPNRIEKAVFGNTFPPNDIIITKNKGKSRIIPLLPEFLISIFGNKQLKKKILPAGNNDPLLTAFLPSLPFSKKQFMNRFAVVVDKFTPKPNTYQTQRIPKLIIESDNDPLVEEVLREDIKKLYPFANVHTFHNEGHFPYINVANDYNKALKSFFNKPDDFKNVEQTIKDYFLGRAAANVDLLKSTFSKNAKLYTVIKGDEVVISLSDYFKKVATDGKKDVNTKILSGNITHNIANFKTEFKYKDKTYQDYLTLLQTSNEWKIITKTFTIIK